MKVNVGEQDQIHAIMPLLEEMSKEAKKVIKLIQQGDEPESTFEAIYPVISKFPFLEINHRTGEITLNDGTPLGLNFKDEDPTEESLDILHAFVLQKDDFEIDTLPAYLSSMASIYEKEKRNHRKGKIIETDGLTCYILALEGSRNKDVDEETIRKDIQNSIKERTLLSDETASFVSAGYKAAIKKNFVHWDYPFRKGQTIAKIYFKESFNYEGPTIYAEIKINSKTEFLQDEISLKNQDIPESYFNSLSHRPIEEVVDDERLHGWGYTTESVTRKTVNNENILNIWVDRQSDDRRLAFIVDC